MANWCFNTVRFTGEENRLTEIKELFQGMAARSIAEEKGQLPPFITSEEGYFFEVDFSGDYLCYQTRWTPNLELMHKVGKYFGVDYTHDYDESSNGIYGQANYRNGHWRDIYLGDAEFEQYHYLDDTELYYFEGDTYDTDGEILETLLERKIKAVQEAKTQKEQS
jgi:hypothetical protein